MSLSRKLMPAAAVVAALSLAGGGPAVAAKHALVLRTSEAAVAPGTEVTLVSHNMRFYESGGVTLECNSAVLSGTLAANDAPTVALSITASAFGTTEAVKCKVIEPREFPIEYESLAAAGLPWTASISWKGTASVAGASGVTLANFEEPFACNYQGKRLRASYEVTGALPLVLRTTPPMQKLRLPRESQCWSRGLVNANEATIAGEWSVFASNQPVYVELTS